MSYREGMQIGNAMQSLAGTMVKVRQLGDSRTRMGWESEDRAENERVTTLAGKLGENPEYNAKENGYSDNDLFKARVVDTKIRSDKYNLSAQGRQEKGALRQKEIQTRDDLIEKANALFAAGDNQGAQQAYIKVAQTSAWKGYNFEDMGDGNIKLTPTEEGGEERIIPMPEIAELQKMATALTADNQAWLKEREGGAARAKEKNSISLVNADFMYNKAGSMSPWRTAVVVDPFTGVSTRVYMDPLDPQKQLTPSQEEINQFDYSPAQRKEADTRNKTEGKDKLKRLDDLTSDAIKEYNGLLKAYMKEGGSADGLQQADTTKFIEQYGAQDEYVAKHLAKFGIKAKAKPEEKPNLVEMDAATVKAINGLTDARKKAFLETLSPEDRKKYDGLNAKETPGGGETPKKETDRKDMESVSDTERAKRTKAAKKANPLSKRQKDLLSYFCEKRATENKDLPREEVFKLGYADYLESQKKQEAQKGKLTKNAKAAVATIAKGAEAVRSVTAGLRDKMPKANLTGTKKTDWSDFL